ncbi:hypothetical protein C7M84_024245, partial [Penaeus vannamei]
FLVEACSQSWWEYRRSRHNNPVVEVHVAQPTLAPTVVESLLRRVISIVTSVPTLGRNLSSAHTAHTAPAESPHLGIMSLPITVRWLTRLHGGPAVLGVLVRPGQRQVVLLVATARWSSTISMTISDTSEHTQAKSLTVALIVHTEPQGKPILMPI